MAKSISKTVTKAASGKRTSKSKKSTKGTKLACAFIDLLTTDGKKGIRNIPVSIMKWPDSKDNVTQALDQLESVLAAKDGYHEFQATIRIMVPTDPNETKEQTVKPDAF